MREALLAQAMAIRSQVDVMIAILAGGLEDGPPPPAERAELCEHKNFEVVGGMGGSLEKKICVDCLEEL